MFPRITTLLKIDLGITHNLYVRFINTGGKHMTHDQIWMAIEKFACEHGMSCSRLARSSGLDPTTFNKSKRWSKFGQPRWPSTGSIAKILSSTGQNIGDFIKYIHDEPNKQNNPGNHM